MKKFKFCFFLIMLLILSIGLTGCNYEVAEIVNTEKNYKDKLVVHFIDVGQGDSTFIQFPNGETSLIDGGTRKSRDKVVNYLQDLGIDKVDYLIATHPHEDHIGGLPEVIRNFSIGKVYMPDKTANTNIFEELLKEIKNKDLKITLAEGGNSIIENEKFKFIILAPNKDDYIETNDFSIVTKIEYMDTSFIFAGDAEKSSELDMIDKNYNLKSNVLKIGHHGGRTSSNEEFLKKVNPDYSIISVGANNTYGHPHKETLDRLNNVGSNIMRTDELGDIVIISNGKEITISEKIITEAETKVQYIGNKNTKIFHTKDCNSLPKEENQIFFNSLEEAKKNGYKPHENCVK